MGGVTATAMVGAISLVLFVICIVSFLAGKVLLPIFEVPQGPFETGGT